MTQPSTISKRPLILLPGLMCDQTIWQDQISALSDIADCKSMDWTADQTSLVGMAEATLQSAPPKFALAGHSMGGRVAFEVYRLAPDRVTHLAVMNTGVAPLAPGNAGSEEEKGRRWLLELAYADGVRVMVKEWLTGMLPPYRLTDLPLTEAITQMFERRPATFFEVQQNALLQRPDARPVLPTIQCPTLVLTGMDDLWSGPARHEEIAAAIPNSQLVFVPRSGHMSTMEQPEAVAKAMRSWLLGA